MEYNVLIGIPAGSAEGLKDTFRKCIANILGQNLREIIFVHALMEFYNELNSATYNLVVAVDDLGRGNDFSQYIVDNPLGRGMNCIVIIPDRCYQSRSLDEFMDRGIYNALFERDVNERFLRELILRPRNSSAASIYYGFDLRPVKSDVNNVSRETMEGRRPDITEKQVADGLIIKRLCASDAKKMTIGEIGEDAVLQSFLRDMDNASVDEYEISEQMPLMEFDLVPEWAEQYKQGLRRYFQREGIAYFQAFENGDLTDEEFHAVVMKVLRKNKLSAEQEKVVLDAFMCDVLSYGKLDAILNTPDISDIRLLNKDTVNVQHKGVWYRSNVTFGTDEEYMHFVNRLCTKNHTSLNVQQAQIIFSDISTNESARLRFMVTHSLLNTNKTSTAHIRKIDKVKKTTSKLIAEGLFTPMQAAFIHNAVKHKKSVIICGGSGSGKTVLLNNMVEVIDVSTCGVCAQEAEEVFSENKPNMEFLHSISARGESKVSYTLRQLSTMALLKNAALFIIGEIKGDEARDFFTAGNTGAQSMCTTHADSCFEALPRIADLAKYTGDYSQTDLLKMMSRSIDYVVYMENYKVKQIAGVVGWDDEREDVIYDLYEFTK